MSDRIAAFDIGFATTGAVIMAKDPSGTHWYMQKSYFIKTEADKSKKALRKADQDVARVAESARKIKAIIETHSIRRMVVEIPHGGGKSSRAVRCMALATAKIATIAELLELAVEWYSPDDTRKAATGSRVASKQSVVDAMGSKHPQVFGYSTQEAREAVADAAATFEAARNGVLVRL